jgi:hypothetical protein
VRIRISPDHPIVTLEDPETFDSFSLVGTKRPTADDRVALNQQGVTFAADDTHAFVRRTLVERLAVEADVDDSWHTGFTAMVDYAESKGWLSADGAIRAHTVWGD